MPDQSPVFCTICHCGHTYDRFEIGRTTGGTTGGAITEDLPDCFEIYRKISRGEPRLIACRMWLVEASQPFVRLVTRVFIVTRSSVINVSRFSAKFIACRAFLLTDGLSPSSVSSFSCAALVLPTLQTDFRIKWLQNKPTHYAYNERSSKVTTSCITSRKVAGMVSQQSRDHITGWTTGHEVARLSHHQSYDIYHPQSCKTAGEWSCNPSYDHSSLVCDSLRSLIAATGILNMFGDLSATDFDRETAHSRWD